MVVRGISCRHPGFSVACAPACFLGWPNGSSLGSWWRWNNWLSGGLARKKYMSTGHIRLALDNTGWSIAFAVPNVSSFHILPNLHAITVYADIPHCFPTYSLQSHLLCQVYYFLALWITYWGKKMAEWLQVPVGTVAQGEWTRPE